MYKSKSASMQRGAYFRNAKARMTLREEYGQTKLVLSTAEQCHFSFGSVQEVVFLRELRPLIRLFGRAGIRKPHEVAKALNRARKRTACGQPWTPRLTWFLLSKLFGPPATSARKVGPLREVPPVRMRA